MIKIAITGATGFVGGNIAKVLQMKGFEVVGLVRREVGELPWQNRMVDFADTDSIARAIDDCSAVVHCAIANDFNRLLDDREYAYDSYVGLTKRVTLAANRAGAKTIFISTDWIMDGTGHLEPETSPGNAINFYGFLKALSEQVVRDLAPETGAICRIAGVMGRHQTAAEGPRNQDVGFGYFVYSIVEALQKGKPFDVWTGPNVNQVTSPSLAAEIGAQIARIVELSAAGTFHLVGDDAVTRMQLAERVCEIFGLEKALLRETLPPESELFPAPVPVDSSLSNLSTKQRLNLGPTSLDDLLRAFKRELETGQLGFLTA